MINHPNESRTAAKPEVDEALALDKETLKDLDSPLVDGEGVKGGARPSLASCDCVTASCIICITTQAR